MHSITMADEELVIPLHLKGVMSYFPVWTPTLYEVENCTNIILTSESEWDPYADIYNESESKLNELHKVIRSLRSEHKDLVDNIAIKTLKVGDMHVNKKANLQTAEQLAHLWAVPTTVARDSLKSTTQEFIRSAKHPIERKVFYQERYAEI